MLVPPNLGPSALQKQLRNSKKNTYKYTYITMYIYIYIYIHKLSLEGASTAAACPEASYNLRQSQGCIGICERRF